MEMKRDSIWLSHLRQIHYYHEILYPPQEKIHRAKHNHHSLNRNGTSIPPMKRNGLTSQTTIQKQDGNRRILQRPNITRRKLQKAAGKWDSRHGGDCRVGDGDCQVGENRGCRVQDRWISVCRGCMGVYGLRKMSMVDIACLYFYACAATLYFAC